MVAPGGSRLPGPPLGPLMVMSCGGGPPSSACSPIIPLLASFTSEESDGKRCFTGTQNSARLSYPVVSFHRTGYLLFFLRFLPPPILFSSSDSLRSARSQLPVLSSSSLLVVFFSPKIEVNKKGTISRNRAQFNWFKTSGRPSGGHFVTAYTRSHSKHTKKTAELQVDHPVIEPREANSIK